MIKPPSKAPRGDIKPGKPHSKGQSHTSRRRNYKLIVDPEIHGKHQEKQYRFDGHTAGNTSIEPRDPRKKVHFALSHEVADLPVPRFKYDQYYVGEVPERRILLSNLNDNVNKDFLLDVCKKHGTVETVSVYSHPQSKRHLGLASVGFKTSRMALEAVNYLDGRSIMGLVVVAQLDPTGSLAKQHVDYLVNPDSTPKPSLSAVHKQPIKTSSIPTDVPSSSLISQMQINKSGQSKNLSYSQKFSMMLAGNPEIEPISPSPPRDDNHTKSDSKMSLSVVSPPPPPPLQPPPSMTPPLPPGSPPTGLALTSISTETRQPIALAEDPLPLPPLIPPPLPSDKQQVSPTVTVNGSVSPPVYTVSKPESERTVHVSSPRGKTLCEEISQHSTSSGYNSATNGVGTPSSGDDQQTGKRYREHVVSLPKQNDITRTSNFNLKHDDKPAEPSADEDMDVSSGSDSELPEFKPSHPPLPLELPPLHPPLPPLPSEPPPLHPLPRCPPLPSEPPPPLPPLPPKSLPPATALPPLPVAPRTLPALPSSQMPCLPVRMPFMSLPPRPVYFGPPSMPPAAVSYVRHPPPMINQNLPPRMRFGEKSYQLRHFNHYSSHNVPTTVDSSHHKSNRQAGRSSRLMEIETKDKERLKKRHMTWSMLEEGRSQLDVVLDKVSEALKLDMLGVLKRDITKQLERCIIDNVESWWEKKTKEEQQEEETEDPEAKSELGSLSLRVGGMSIRVDKNGLVTYEPLPKMPSFLKRSLPVQPERLPGMARRQDSRDKGAKRSLTVNDDEDEEEPSAKRRIEEVWSDEDTSDHVESDSESERSVSASSESAEESGSEFSEEDIEESESASDNESSPTVEEYVDTRPQSTVKSTLVHDMTESLTTEHPTETPQTSSVVDIPSTAETTESMVTTDKTASHHVTTLQSVPASLPVPSASFYMPALALAMPTSASAFLPSSAFLVIPAVNITSRQPVVPTDSRQREEEESMNRADSGDKEASSKEMPVAVDELLDSRERDLKRQEREILDNRQEEICIQERETSSREEPSEATDIVENETEVMSVQEPVLDAPVVYSAKEEQANHIVLPPSPKPQYTCRTAEEETKICQRFFNELDDEDRKMMRTAFLQLQEEKDPSVENCQWSYHPPFPLSSEFLFEEWTGGAYKRHETGCARCEGYYKISHIEKRRYLKHGDTSNKEQRGQQESEKARHLSRENRAQFRRVAAEFGTATSLISLNQLDIRKKMLKFAKSTIHGWGLYALEHIAADEMVIEYVGEVVRNEVADRREKQYEQRGMGSSYMFRVDQEYVIDATHRGNFARFINHCCEPNCTAKVINVGCEKRIVIYSKRDIHVNEEITYDYKFPLEEDKIHCLCGAPGCRGSLN